MRREKLVKRGERNIRGSGVGETTGASVSSGTSPGQISGCFFANAGVGSSDDDRFPIQPLLRRPAMAARIAERKEKTRGWGAVIFEILIHHECFV